MNKLLLGSAAIAGLVLASAPAQAQMELTIGGHTKNYIGWLNQDENNAGIDTRGFDMQRETELHFNGESTLDNGLTFGFQIETEMDAGDGKSLDRNGDGDTDTFANVVEESYIYLSGAWGRINLGSEDGAAYLLQVAAPSADANIDGIRQYVQPVNYANLFGVAPTTLAFSANAFRNPAGSTDVDGFDYDHDLTGKSEKITYLSPNWNGFQVGASYTHDVNDDNSNMNNFLGFNSDDQTGLLGSAYEGAVRYEGVFSNFGYALGAGYMYADLEAAGVSPITGLTANDDYSSWNVGFDVDYGPFGFGGVYLDEEQDHTVAAGVGSEVTTWTVGGDYTTGPFKFGATYYNQKDETNAGGGSELDTDRYTGGVIYTAGPGLSFRGSISYIEHEVAGGVDANATSVMGGVQINF